MSHAGQQQESPTLSRDTAGAFGFRRREVIVLLIVAGVIGCVSLWQWWQRKEAMAARQWSVDDVYVDSLMLAPGTTSPEVASDNPPAENSTVLVDVNTADASELMRLPGIGPALASRILASRQADGPFQSLDDLQRVRGIGPRTAARMAAWVRFSHGQDTTVTSSGEAP